MGHRRASAVGPVDLVVPCAGALSVAGVALPWARAGSYFGQLLSVPGYRITLGVVFVILTAVAVIAWALARLVWHQGALARVVTASAGIGQLAIVSWAMLDVKADSASASFATGGAVVAKAGGGLVLCALAGAGMIAFTLMTRPSAVASEPSLFDPSLTPPRGTPVLDLTAPDPGGPTAVLAGTARSSSSPAAAWYPDPSGEHALRWWDGTRWTTHVWGSPTQR